MIFYMESEFKSIVKSIRKNNLKEITLLWPHEWEPWAPTKFIETIKQYDVTINWVLGCFESEDVAKRIKKLGLEDNVNLLYWPTFWCAAQFLDGSTKRVKIPKKFPNKIICLNCQPHLHRCITIDEMVKNELHQLPDVSLSLIMPSNTNYEWKHHTGLPINRDMMSHHLDHSILPKAYKNAFWDFVTESSHFIPFVTEKFYRGTYQFKIPVTLGCVGYNTNYIKNLGFELYDEYIDYSFDTVDDLETRCKMFVEQMSTVIDMNQNVIYNESKEKIIHNREIVKSLVDNYNYIPEEIQHIDWVKNTITKAKHFVQT